MLFLTIFVTVAILGLVYMSFEARFVQVTHTRFTKNKEGLKILHLSDIHVKLLKVSSKKVSDIISKEPPDITIISGDFIDTPQHIDKFFSFYDNIQWRSKVFICFGNHDYKAFLHDKNGFKDFVSQIEKRGATILHNKSVIYRKGNQNYNIIGIADLRYKHHDVNLALKSCAGDAINVGFSHNPDIVLEIPENKLDYLLCGHFHGGQIWAPFDIEFSFMRNEKLCRMGIKRGLHKVNGIKLYINRGLGNVVFPFRFMSRPEMAYLYLP